MIMFLLEHSSKCHCDPPPHPRLPQSFEREDWPHHGVENNYTKEVGQAHAQYYGVLSESIKCADSLARRIGAVWFEPGLCKAFLRHLLQILSTQSFVRLQ